MAHLLPDICSFVFFAHSLQTAETFSLRIDRMNQTQEIQVLDDENKVQSTSTVKGRSLALAFCHRIAPQIRAATAAAPESGFFRQTLWEHTRLAIPPEGNFGKTEKQSIKRLLLLHADFQWQVRNDMTA